MSAIGKLASWMMQHGYATGHGESVDDLLAELTWQIKEKIEMEREACAKVCEDLPADELFTRTEAFVWDVATLDCAAAIRARGKS